MQSSLLKIQVLSNKKDIEQYFYTFPILSFPLLSLNPLWSTVMNTSLNHTPYLIVLEKGEKPFAFLSMSLIKGVSSRYLISNSYLNYGGVVFLEEAEKEGTRTKKNLEEKILDKVKVIADQQDVDYVELRSIHLIENVHFKTHNSSKLNAPLPLKADSDTMWGSLTSSTRNQIRKGMKSDLTIDWGGSELAADFYQVFSRNMRDLGSPAFPKTLFETIAQTFPIDAEFCVVRKGKKPIASALLLHGKSITEVPSASCLREFNSLNANMLLYWNLVCRAIERKQSVFDMGRCNPNSGPARFKKNWGANLTPVAWSYYIRKGNPNSSRRESKKFRYFILIWKKMPVFVTNIVGPYIVKKLPI